MIREQKAPSGPRPDFSPSITYDTLQMDGRSPMAHTDSLQSQEDHDSTPRPRLISKEPMLNASSRNNHSLFSFGGEFSKTDENGSPSYEFLPSPSFDDLQSSINAASKDLSLESLAAAGNNTVVGGKRPIEAMEAPNEGRGIAGARAVSGPRPARAGSILRRQSTSTRQSSISSTTSAASGNMDPPNGPPTTRNRRQSQYPPISGGGVAVGSKAPRKSIGPGVIDSDYSRPTQKRRPSLASSTTSNQGLSDNGGVSTRINIGGTPSYTEGARGLTASRAAKTKSLQPPSRQGQTRLTPNTNTPEHSRSASLAGRSPGRPNGRGTNTPSSSSKRMSVMPGMPQGNHATGLGARTISPTDARRAKRLSILQQPPPMPHTPPTAQPDKSIRNSSRSPSMLPRKISTPSSSRTTPDFNRKSYSSGISIGSNASYNTSRTSTGSLQPRLSQQPPTSSRLPTPKPRNVHSSAENNEEEEVPPVPAIPKAYESPKDSPAEPPFFNKRKSSMPFDASSINSTSTNSLSRRSSVREPIKAEREHKPRHYVPAASHSDDQQNLTTPVKKKNLQPLRLPPLNLLPLSTPTVAKIAALGQEPDFSDGQITPPPRRVNARTPSTPMTASKASFFSRKRADDPAVPPLQHVRSSSSIHHLRSESSSQLGGSSSESSKPIAMNRAPRQTVSPFVSTSLPKNGSEHSFMSRSKTSSDFTTAESAPEHRPARLTGPRAQKLGKAPKTETPSQISSPEEPTTPSSGSSLRRKLSLGWKRSTSKSNIISHAANERGSEYAPLPPKHDNMPPPKIPASATLNSLNTHSVPSPSPSVKSTTYLDSKRRKSSISSLSVFNGHDRTRSDSWGINGSPKKDQPVENKTERPLPSSRTTSSVMHKMLSSKTSPGNIKSPDPWTTDLDRDDLLAEDEMKRLGSRRKETESAAKALDALRKRAAPRERLSPQQTINNPSLNIYEKGEIVDFQDVYFCGSPGANKHIGELSTTTLNFGYDDERGDYTIVPGDHLLYRYEIVDVLGKGSFGQVVRCIDHKTGTLVAVKIIRNKKRFHQQALVEVNILKKLREWVSPIRENSFSSLHPFPLCSLLSQRCSHVFTFGSLWVCKTRSEHVMFPLLKPPPRPS
jgi:dual specificity tyrosine-phosphorylation-regulated kinase 2/3/4